jgi:hypothetical protein
LLKQSSDIISELFVLFSSLIKTAEAKAKARQEVSAVYLHLFDDGEKLSKLSLRLL